MKTYNYNDRINKLTSLDDIRLLKLFEMIQYSIIYFVLIILLAHVINKYYFSNVDVEDIKKEEKNILNFIKLVGLTIFETIIIVILVFYIRKLALVIPSYSSLINKKFIPHTTMEYVMHVALTYVLLELLPKFKIKFDILYEYIK